MDLPKHLGLTLLTLAACGAAHAQSTVTLYGLVDLNLTRTTAGSKAGGASQIDMNDGTVNGLNGSRWGLRVAEDLGSGLKAGVVLEGGLLADTGAAGQGGRSFGRQAFLSLNSASAGELRLGRQYVLSDSVMGTTNPFGNALTLNPGTGVTNMGKALPMWLNVPRADNVIQYQTPSFGGAQLAVQAAPEEGGTMDRFHGVKLSYAGGPVVVAASYEWNKSRTTGDNTNKSLTVGANYNFGAFKLLAGVQRNRDLALNSGNGAAAGVSNLTVTTATTFTAARTDDYTVGVEVPVGNFLLGTNYTSVKYQSATGTSATLGKVAVGARYGLSKNTFLYTSASQATGDLKDYISQNRVVQAGLRTAF
jgi:general bacterial porin, GBP family